MYSTATHIFLYLKEVIIIIVSLLNNDNDLYRQIDLDNIPFKILLYNTRARLLIKVQNILIPSIMF